MVNRSSRSIAPQSSPISTGRGLGPPLFIVEDRRQTIVIETFSTIASPVFSELVIVLERGLTYQETSLFETLRKMSEVRHFTLVFLIEASDSYQEKLRGESARALGFKTANGSLDFLDSPPTIRVARPPYSGRWGFPHFY